MPVTASMLPAKMAKMTSQPHSGLIQILLIVPPVTSPTTKTGYDQYPSYLWRPSLSLLLESLVGTAHGEMRRKQGSVGWNRKLCRGNRGQHAVATTKSGRSSGHPCRMRLRNLHGSARYPLSSASIRRSVSANTEQLQANTLTRTHQCAPPPCIRPESTHTKFAALLVAPEPV